MTHSPYLSEIHQALPRVLGIFDTNPISPMRGVGDRYCWAWKGSDFANGTFQGAVHGLSLLVSQGMLPENISQQSVMRRINEVLRGIRTITQANGSLDEILPLESSYCVTALVAFDALCALDILSERLAADDRAYHTETVRPLIAFLCRSRESHGIISNHLAVAAAALTRWHRMTGEDVIAARDDVVGVIMAHHSKEGWFSEYEGADPGYQTLALDYLVDMATVSPALGLMPSLAKTCEFLTYCAHPDGSFGGLYGSRNTRFLYPAGIEAMASQSAHAAALAVFARKAHKDKTVVGLAAMDDSNLIPMFNSFCRAAALAANRHADAATLPCATSTRFYREFPEAGLVVTRGDDAYTVINWRKGAVSHFAASAAVIDGGVCAKDKNGAWYTSQTARHETRLASANAQEIVIDAPVQRYRVAYPTPFQMVILRLLCLTVMRLPVLNAWIKRILVWLLISRKEAARSIVRRTIHLHPALRIEDVWIANPDGLQFEPSGKVFQAVHMASQGYWQRGDDA